MRPYLALSNEARVALAHARLVVRHDTERTEVAIYTTIGIRDLLLGLATAVPDLLVRYTRLEKLFQIWNAQSSDGVWWLPNRSPEPSHSGPIRADVTKRAIGWAFERARHCRHLEVTGDDLLVGAIAVAYHQRINWSHLTKKQRHEAKRLIAKLVTDVSATPVLVP